jgi:hypothetical protein
MADNFYSKTELILATGALNLATTVGTDPVTWGATATELTNYTALATSYSNALDVALAPATRTRVTVEQKNVLKKSLRTATVNLSRIISASSSVTNAMLIEVGLNPRPTRQPRPLPLMPPAVDILSVVGRLMKGRVHSTEEEKRGLPFGATGANIFSYVGPTPATDPREYHFQGMTTRALFEVNFPNSVPSGATVWISASWVNARGQIGIASTPVSFTLQGGPVSAAV